MPVRRIDLLLNEARQESDNIEFSDSTGLPDESFLRWSNSAQKRIMSRILQEHPDVFQTEKIITVVQGQEAYSLPSDTFLGTRLENLEYSRDGQARNYYRLQQGKLPERLNGNAGSPEFYIRRSSEILIQPKPQAAGTLRLTLQRRIPRLDKRRGTVSAVTLDTVNRMITSLTLDTTQFIDAERLQDEYYMSVVDIDGNVQMRAIPVLAVSEATGIVTIGTSFVYEEGETIAVGDYVLLGEYSTTHSQLDEVCERYLTEFMIWKAKKRDSDAEAPEDNQELAAIEEEIVASYAEADSDVDYVPIIDGNFLDSEV